MEAAPPVQQSPSVPGSPDRLNEKQEPKPLEQPAEERRCHDHEGRHHHEAQNDQGGGAVVVKVTADGGGGVEDLRGDTEGSVTGGWSLSDLWTQGAEVISK